jgi:Flp pilus assembly protein TadD
LKQTLKRNCSCWEGILVLSFVCFSAAAQPTNADLGRSVLIEAAGHVECFTDGNTNWRSAVVGTTLVPGDRVRTHEQSRAAVQLSDRSVIRLSERTTLELLPPRRAEKKRFGLSSGSLYFFDREKPADVEFDTPLAAGAIRGTEFLLAVANDKTALRLALIDGRVSLNTTNGEVSLEGGEDLTLSGNQAATKTALVNVNSAIQWALYYPAVLDPDELSLTTDETTQLSQVLAAYRAGDLMAALAKWPANSTIASYGVQTFHAALLLAVGDVNEAEKILNQLPSNAPEASALRELIAVVKGSGQNPTNPPATASQMLARSYSLQAKADLPAALAIARQAARRAPNFGFAHARLAELEFSFGNRRTALAELETALSLSPRLAPAHALRGFVLLEQGDTTHALASFDKARDLDAAFSPAWLGRGMCLLRERDFANARASFQAAAALEPQRALFRAYLGKAASELGHAKAAEKELNLAKTLDPNDPTAWLYSALHLWQENRINEAIRDLEHAEAVNDSRAPFRSRLLLDEDRSVASADLAAIYGDAGLGDVGRHTAARAVAEDYANFSGHLFLANSLQAMEDVNRFDLRFETARQSELLVANLLAPPGAGNLSQQFSQQEHLQFFDPRPVAVSSLSEYSSHGDWHEAGTIFGSVDGFSYALDTDYQDLNGWQPNGQSTVRQLALTAKQRITPQDDAYFQIGNLQLNSGDAANHFNPADAAPGFHAEESQIPTLYAGWHHEWSPGSHTLLLFARLNDRLSLNNPNSDILFLQTDLSGSTITAVQNGPLPPPPPPGNQGPAVLDFSREFNLYSAELQQIFESPKYSLVLGGRFQSGDILTHAALNEFSLGVPQQITNQKIDGTLRRANGYAYGSWKIIDPLTVVAGASYDHLEFPLNADLPPLSIQETSRDLFSPKAGLLFQPWKQGLFRASYTKSLGGLYFDNSVRLEPSQVAGFNQAFRSLIPESVAGIVPGTEFQTIGFGFDQSLPSDTWFGIEAEQLDSKGHRDVGAFQFFSEFLTPDTANSTSQTLNFRERDLSAYVGQLLGNDFSLAARYRISEGKLTGRFPQIPDTALGLSDLEQNNTATLQQISLAANYHNRYGFFAQWESNWYHQRNLGYTPTLSNADFWQHNLTIGYRLPRRRMEISAGILNLFDQDYRLNPLNLHAELPRGRTFVTSLQLNF